MKIDGYASPAADLALPPKTVVTGTSGSSPDSSAVQASAEDTTSFSSGTASVQAFTEAALGSSERAGKIASLQQLVQSGKYTVDPVQIASALANAKV